LFAFTLHPVYQANEHVFFFVNMYADNIWFNNANFFGYSTISWTEQSFTRYYWTWWYMKNSLCRWYQVNQIHNINQKQRK